MKTPEEIASAALEGVEDSLIGAERRIVAAIRQARIEALEEAAKAIAVLPFDKYSPTSMARFVRQLIAREKETATGNDQPIEQASGMTIPEPTAGDLEQVAEDDYAINTLSGQLFAASVAGCWIRRAVAAERAILLVARIILGKPDPSLVTEQALLDHERQRFVLRDRMRAAERERDEARKLLERNRQEWTWLQQIVELNERPASDVLHLKCSAMINDINAFLKGE